MLKLKSIRKELAVVVLAIIVLLFAGFIFIPINRLYCESENNVVYISYIMAAAIAFLIAQWAYDKWCYQETEASFLGFSVKNVLLGLMGTSAVTFFMAKVVSAASQFTDNPYIVGSNVGTGYGDWDRLEVLVLLVATSMVAPIVEETIVRGLLLTSLNKVFGDHKAVIASSLFFGALHLTSVSTVMTTTLMGIVLAYVYMANRNLLDSIIVHVVHNTFVTYMAVNVWG